MAIKSSGSSLTFSEIENEFGSNDTRSLGGYRTRSGGDSYPQSFPGGLNFGNLDGGIPNSGEIKFSQFYDKKLNIVVDFHSGGSENSKNGKTRYDAGSADMVGGFASRPSNTSGKRVYLHVNKTMGSDNANQRNCALKTGTGWQNGTDLKVFIGSSGKLLGSGGNGGTGASGGQNIGGQGGNGSSALGIEYRNILYNGYSVSPVNRVRFDKSTNVYTFTYLNSDRGTSTTTKLTVVGTEYEIGSLITSSAAADIYEIRVSELVTIQNNGRIQAGFGGGGGGAGRGLNVKTGKKSSAWRTSSGGGGGGGAGLPAGAGGVAPQDANWSQGSDGSAGQEQNSVAGGGGGERAGDGGTSGGSDNTPTSTNAPSGNPNEDSSAAGGPGGLNGFGIVTIQNQVLVANNNVVGRIEKNTSPN